MLSLRPAQAMVLFVLAVLLICVVIVHANANVTSKEGDFSGAFWKISTGKYKWGACGADSWHRVFIDNDSRFDVTANWTWTQWIMGATNNREYRKTTLTGSVFLDTPRKQKENKVTSYTKEGWLNNDNGLGDGRYKIKSSVKLKLKNNLNNSTKTHTDWSGVYEIK